MPSAPEPSPARDDALGQAARWRDEGLGVALATVVRTWGSSPRPAGSQLAVNERGAFAGSVSGGCVEGAVVEAALGVIAAGAPRVLVFGVTNEMAWEVGLACGGEVEIRVERVEKGAVLARLLDDRAERRPAVLLTALATGAQALFHPDEPATAPPDPALHEAARAALAADRSLVVESAAGRVFVQAFPAPMRLVVVGAVHVAQPLSRMAALAGFDVIVVDPRRSFASAARFPDVALVTEWPGDALRGLRLDARTAVVTLTHDPKLDDPALAAALRSPCGYVGALGSRRTHAARLARLREQGFADADLARIHGPVGLAIGARSAAEIAVSILAELVQCLRAAQDAEPA